MKVMNDISRFATTAKMADVVVNSVNGSPILVGKDSVNNCMCCGNLKLELRKTMLELILAHEIIRLLQEEISIRIGYGSTHGQVSLQKVLPEETERTGNDWTRVTTGQHNKSSKPAIIRVHPKPQSVNRYQLPNTPKNTTLVAHNSEMNKDTSNNKKKRGRETLLRKKHKVIIVGDSHARGCAAELSRNLGETSEITGYVKPGTGLETITNTAREEIGNLTKEDVILMWGGSNDIGKNASPAGLKHISNFAKCMSHTNIMTMNAPHRYDLLASSCVNKEVEVFNRKLEKIMKVCDNTKVIELNLNRDHLTQHGLHMNAARKALIAHKIADVHSFIYHP
jgi:hypothetical protein